MRDLIVHSPSDRRRPWLSLAVSAALVESRPARAGREEVGDLVALEEAA